MNQSLDLIALDMPDPPDYGGVIDIYYKIKALAELGLPIRLHAFRYGDRSSGSQLSEWCREVYYYPRPRSWRQMIRRDPFIVVTRKPKLLLDRLAARSGPILMEGLHSCGFLAHPLLADRRKVVRLHNIEWRYYANLSQREKRLNRKVYLHWESRKLKQFEKRVLGHADALLAISGQEEAYYAQRWAKPVAVLPPFHPYERIAPLPGRGDYALFHGKLEVPDNEAAALFLARNLSPLDIPLVIAGKNPSPNLQRQLAGHPRVRLIANPDGPAMDNLQRNAQLHLLHSFQADGFKLKLLHALFSGRFVLANPEVAAGTGLEDLCSIYRSSEELLQQVRVFWKKDFSTTESQRRTRALFPRFNNRRNAEHLLNILYPPDIN